MIGSRKTDIPGVNSSSNHDGLRTQLIDAMCFKLQRDVAERLFDVALWPVLEAAIEAGTLTVWRNTVKPIPVHLAVHIWLKGFLKLVEQIRGQEATTSKAAILKLLYQLEDQAKTAFNDAENISPLPREVTQN